MSIAYTLRRRDSRSFTSTGTGVTFTVATGTRGPNIVSDATALGTLTDAAADALFVLAANAAGTFARKVTLGSVARSFLASATQAAARTAIDAEQAGTASSAIAAHLAAVNPHTQYALLAAANTFTAGPQVFVGGATVRQTGGTAGTHEGQHSHGGSTGGYDICSMSGPLWLRSGQNSGNILFSRASDGTGANSAVVAVMGGVPRVRLRADVPLTWSASAADTLGTGDTGLARNGVNCAEVNTGTAGVFGDLKVRDISYPGWWSSSESGFAALGFMERDAKFRLAGTALDVVNGFGLVWRAGNYAGAANLGLTRNADGVAEFNNGTAGQYRDLIARKYTASSSGDVEQVVLTNTTFGRGIRFGWENGGATPHINCDDTLVLRASGTVQLLPSNSTYGIQFGSSGLYGRTIANQVGDVVFFPIHTTYCPAVFRGMSGQTRNLSEWQNNASTVLAGLTAAGRLLFNAADTAPSDTVTPAQWLTCTVNGVQYRLPLYL